MKKLLLVVPNFRWSDADENALWHYVPYNLCLLASCVRDICDVTILDAYKQGLTQAQFADRLAGLNPNIVGVTAMMDKYGPSAHTAARIAKEHGATTIIGGVYATVNTEQAAADPNVDTVVKGEGERVLRDYLLGNTSGKILVAGRVNNLDAIPLPAYDLIEYADYTVSAPRKSVDRPAALPYARMLTSRGCPFGCVFCQVEQIAGKQFRARSVDNVLNEMEWLRDRHGIKSLMFDDDNMLIDRQRAIALFNGMVERGLTMPWVMTATAAFKLNEELVAAMAASGCVYVDIAIESGTDRVLHEIIRKPLDLGKAKDVVRMLQAAGIYVAANVILGFPSETWDEIRTTLDYADKLGADYTKVFAAIPLRNTRLWDMCREQGAFKDGFNSASQWSAGQIETKHFKANDLTILRAYEWDRINFSDAAKRKRTCERMGVSECDLMQTRRSTLANALREVSNHQ